MINNSIRQNTAGRRRIPKFRKPAAVRSNAYRYKTWDTSYTVLMDLRTNADTLTPLHHLAAPGLHQLPADIQRELKREFYERGGADSDWNRKYAAQDWLAGDVAAFEKSRVHVAFDDSALADIAAKYAKTCQRMHTLEAMQDWCRRQSIEPPIVGAPKQRTRVSCIRRLQDPRWWRASLRRYWTGTGEAHLRAIGVVQKRRQVYASDHMVKCRRGRKARDKAILKDMLAVSDQGDQLELWDIVKASQSNPALRRAELMVRMRGFEEVAAAAGHVAQFFTLTCPSAFHRTHIDGRRNANYAGFSARDGQEWLSKMWARARSKLDRLNVLIYGFRIAEPHHDGTPHWHMVLFSAPHQARRVRFILRQYWLSEYANEAGAAERRSQVIRIDPRQGSAAGYLAKYVAKNIDGFQVGDDYETGSQATDSSERVLAWASANRIRQFQQIGGPAVGVWRELRRLRAGCSVATIEAARVHADAGEWGLFIQAIGGIRAGRATNVTLWSERTGELNRYDELRGKETVGIVALAGRLRTRCKVWRLQKKGTTATAFPIRSGSGSPLGPVPITVRPASPVPTAPPAKKKPRDPKFSAGIVGMGLALSRAGPRIH